MLTIFLELRKKYHLFANQTSTLTHISTNMFRNLISLFFFFLIAVVATAESDEVTCVDWQLNNKKFKKAFAKWKEPSCYSFTFVDAALEHRPEIKRVIKNGVALRKKPYRALQTMNDFYKLIKSKCIQGCPDNGASYYCYIEYKTDRKTGLVYPWFVSISYDSEDVYDHDNYIIENVRIGKCG
ncbi:hypothetical protein FisN_15Lu353 [Fistulifera solaris]|uniref:Cystatin domain-containing protein n=1 Tax=Fistulifera solaris TaxID=1519565 RepID=A0A1Z5JZ95_FISSO|nr:hypothetical protein FisN_15Lu353 [Fistulifera solaris]|eukprot:GAX19176.1 hypothetical protein FisN_15Lu353 [Fistulifera solaris]